MGDWKDNLTELIPYKPGEQTDGEGVIKLNSNENPYPPSSAVGEALINYSYKDLNKYPALGINAFEKTVADYYNVETGNVLSGNSSDEILAMCFRAFFNSKKPIFFPDITYSFYPVWCGFYSQSFEEIPLSETLEIDINDYTKRENGGIIIPNPNAPTGIELDSKVLEELVGENRSSIVIIDEAYSDFGEESAIQLIKKYDNLLVTKTMSKGRNLAGLRVGYAVGSEILISALGAAMHSFNAYPLSSISIKLAEASIKDEEYFQEITDKIKNTREKTAEMLIKKGFKVTDSKTNFLFITHDRINAGDLYARLFERKILVRHFNRKRINNYLRVSIGTDEEMNLFLNEVQRYMEDMNVI